MPDPSYSDAAGQLLAHEAHRLPDLSPVTVLVPHFQAAQALLAGLRAIVDAPVFLPPRVLTLPALAGEAPGADQVEPESRRLADIYGFLKRGKALPENRLWAAAAELADLVRELSDQLLAPPADYPAFAARLEAAYRRGLNAPMDYEARLAFELWHALQQGSVPDVGRDYAERLAWLAARAQTPLYHLGLRGLTLLEQRFFELYAAHAPVRGLALPPGDAARAQFLAACATPGPAPETSPFAGGLRLSPASSREDEARTAAAQILSWLASGRSRIAVLALDRVSARRLRALLERHQVLVQDETGWTFATAAVSHVLDRWFALLQDDCYHRDLLDLLKSPYLFADIDPQPRQEAVAALERAQRRQGVIEGLARFRRLAHEQGLDLAERLLDRIEQASRLFGRGRQALAAWQASLLGSLGLLGATPALAADMAGSQLLAMLQRLQADMASDATPYRFAEWRRWLMLHLDRSTFVDSGVDSPVRFTHLRAARLRAFDGVVMLGADATRLPERPQAGLFNEAVRAELGLRGQAWRDALLREAFDDVLCRTPEILVTWQARREGEPNALSPWLEWLDLQHYRHYGSRLREWADVSAAGPSAIATEANGSSPPRPCPGEVPERVTVSAWQSLIACPYLFFARHQLRLNELDEVPEEMDKRDYGTLLHAALADFHGRHPRLLEVDPASLVEALAAAVAAAFNRRPDTPYLAEAWRQRWQRHQAAYLEWALAWERAGHRFERAEVKLAVEVICGVRPVRFEGRLDRLDRGPGGLAVLDYKTNAPQGLKVKLKTPGEDVQLPAYAWLAGAAQAGFVSLDANKVEALLWPTDLTEAAEAEAARFAQVFAGLAEGAALPAQGVGSVCEHCEMRGLCRRDYWTDVQV